MYQNTCLIRSLMVIKLACFNLIIVTFIVYLLQTITAIRYNRSYLKMYGLFNPIHEPRKAHPFLSAGQRCSVRSLSSTDATMSLQSPLNSTGFKIPSYKTKQENSKTKLDLSLFHKNEAGKTKNGINKCTMNRCQFMYNDSKETALKDKESLHMMIREMKQTVLRLEKENLILREQQLGDIRTIRQQNHIIIELEKVAQQYSFIAPKSVKNQYKFLVPSFSQSSDLSCWCCVEQGKRNVKSQKQGMANILFKLKEERDQLRGERDQFREERDQLRRERDEMQKSVIKLQNEIREKDRQIYQINEAFIEKQKPSCLSNYLAQMCRQKNVQIELIDSILA